MGVIAVAIRGKPPWAAFFAVSGLYFGMAYAVFNVNLDNVQYLTGYVAVLFGAIAHSRKSRK
jgi:hypothetical protein